MSAKAPAWFVYMLECRGGRIYTGICVDVAARLKMHRRGKGAAFTRINPPRRMLAAMRCTSRSAALKAEFRLKQLPRPDKLAWAALWPLPKDPESSQRSVR
jgi:putative endonuclease